MILSLSPEHLFLVILVLVVSGGVQGASGFGFGLVAVSLLGGVLPMKQASVMLVLASLAMNIYILHRLREHITFERMRWMLAGSVIGVPLGVWLLIAAEEGLLRRLLGVVLLATVVQQVIPGIKGKRWHPVWIGGPCGLVSGALSGAFATGGPPAVAYVQSQQFDRFRYAACVQVPLLVAAVVRLICLGSTGLFTVPLLGLSLLGVACAIGGAWLGLHALKRLPDRAVRAIVLVMLLFLAIKYLGIIEAWL